MLTPPAELARHKGTIKRLLGEKKKKRTARMRTESQTDGPYPATQVAAHKERAKRRKQQQQLDRDEAQRVKAFQAKMLRERLMRVQRELNSIRWSTVGTAKQCQLSRTEQLVDRVEAALAAAGSQLSLAEDSSVHSRRDDSPDES